MRTVYSDKTIDSERVRTLFYLPEYRQLIDNQSLRDSAILF